MKGSSFPGSLLFAAFAGLGAMPWLALVGHQLGGAWATALYALAMVALHAAVIAPSWARASLASAAAAVLGVGVAVLSPTPLVAVAAGAAVLACVRTGLLFRSAPARALAIEAILLGSGLALVRLLFAPTHLGAALAIWTFFLVQSLFFLAGGMAERNPERPAGDPFEEARRRAIEILEC